MQANSHLPKRKIYLTETFESYNHEERNSKFLMDSSIYRGIKYIPSHPGTMMSAKS